MYVVDLLLARMHMYPCVYRLHGLGMIVNMELAIKLLREVRLGLMFDPYVLSNSTLIIINDTYIRVVTG